MTTTRTRWLAAAAALIAALLSTAAPAVAQTSAAPADQIVDQWAVGKDWTLTPVDSSRQAAVDQWAVGKDWSGRPGSIVDQWAVGKDWALTPVERPAPTVAPRPLTSTQVQLLVAGLLVAAVLGATTATAVSRHRRTSSAH